MDRLWGLVCRKGPSGFGACSTAEQVTDGIDASNITAIVTGATSGIGMETARVLALRGATVIIPARSKESGEKVKEKIVEEVADAKIEVMELDLSSLASVRSFAAAFLSSNKPLNLLIPDVTWELVICAGVVAGASDVHVKERLDACVRVYQAEPSNPPVTFSLAARPQVKQQSDSTNS